MAYNESHEERIIMDKSTAQTAGLLVVFFGGQVLLVRYLINQLKAIKIQHEISVKSELFK
jgi:hypothetical protein